MLLPFQKKRVRAELRKMLITFLPGTTKDMEIIQFGQNANSVTCTRIAKCCLNWGTIVKDKHTPGKV